MYKYIDFNVEIFEQYFISKHHFSGGGVLLNFIYGHSLSYSRGRGRAKSDGCCMRGEAVKVLHFAEVIRIFDLCVVCITAILD